MRISKKLAPIESGPDRGFLALLTLWVQRAKFLAPNLTYSFPMLIATLGRQQARTFCVDRCALAGASKVRIHDALRGACASRIIRALGVKFGTLMLILNDRSGTSIIELIKRVGYGCSQSIRIVAFWIVIDKYGIRKGPQSCALSSIPPVGESPLPNQGEQLSDAARWRSRSQKKAPSPRLR